MQQYCKNTAFDCVIFNNICATMQKTHFPLHIANAKYHMFTVYVKPNITGRFENHPSISNLIL